MLTVAAASPGLTPVLPLRPAGAEGGTRAPGRAAGLPGAGDLSPEEQQIVRDLKRRDAEVRQHEQAHKAAGGPYASPPTYEYTTGPDGRRYAVAGEVKIDASPVQGNPEATIRKMEVVKRAALAPAEPSPQDRAVAAQADALKAQAETERRKQKEAEEGPAPTATPAPPGSPEAVRQRAEAAYARATALLSAAPVSLLFA